MIVKHIPLVPSTSQQQTRGRTSSLPGNISKYTCVVARGIVYVSVLADIFLISKGTKPTVGGSLLGPFISAGQRHSEE